MPPVSPFAALRYSARAGELQRLICPPYDVISREEQAQLQALSPYNAVYLELPRDRRRCRATALGAEPALHARSRRRADRSVAAARQRARCSAGPRRATQAA